MKKIKLVPVAPVAPAVTVDTDAAIQACINFWDKLKWAENAFGKDDSYTKDIRSRWFGAREVIRVLGLDKQYLSKCVEADNAR